MRTFSHPPSSVTSNFSNRCCYYTACKVNSQEDGVNFSNSVCLHNKEVS
nr:MAG TPA: hypothetical protein [Caudoviricetes sp.]